MLFFSPLAFIILDLYFKIEKYQVHFNYECVLCYYYAFCAKLILSQNNEKSFLKILNRDSIEYATILCFHFYKY